MTEGRRLIATLRLQQQNKQQTQAPNSALTASNVATADALRQLHAAQVRPHVPCHVTELATSVSRPPDTVMLVSHDCSVFLLEFSPSVMVSLSIALSWPLLTTRLCCRLQEEDLCKLISGWCLRQSQRTSIRSKSVRRTLSMQASTA